MNDYSIPIYSVKLVRDSVQKSPSKQVLSPEAAVEVVRRYLDGADREHLIVVMLDSHNKIIGLNTVSIGTIESTLASPKEIFKPAILANAHGIILAHNHPSGDATPSIHDKRLFKDIYECGELLQIKLLDAIIIGDGTDHYYSARRNSYNYEG